MKPNDGDITLIFGDRSVTHAEFTSRVADLARQLIAAGVGPEVSVAVAMPRSVELMVGLHAIITAGGAYVPLDIEAPADRIEYMVETAGCNRVLVCAGEVPEVITGLGGRVKVIEVDASGPVPKVAPITDTDRVGPVNPDSAAYTLFTSGSTGRPKGVTVTHRAIANRLEWMRDWYALGSDDVFVQKTPITFDVSVWELFLPAAVGATMVIAEPGRHGDAVYLANLIERENISVIHFVPSMLAAFADTLGDRFSDLSSLRVMFTSGEALTASVAHRAFEAIPQLELQNLYGPTEAAVDVTAHRVTTGDRTVPIGVPVPATTVYILDRWLQWVPPGVPGELYLGGVQLARGYESRPDLTAERFVADPFGGAGNRLYRTGDLVRWNRSGQIEYLGRTDFQVKLRGQRMELGEVEAVLASAPGVVNAAAAVVNFPAGEQLVGYLSPPDVDTDQVAQALAVRLPEYMRPTQWVLLDELPLNSAGKVARRELPMPQLREAEYAAPEGDAEEALAAVFADVLGVERVGATESFFDAGGNSLSAMRVAARAGEALDVEFSVRDLFDYPTVRELAAAATGKAPALAPVTAVVPRPERIPLSFAQQRMWFINRFDPTLPTYNIPTVLRITGSLDVAALRAAFADVVRRHEVLRTTFPEVDGDAVQLIASESEVETSLPWQQVASEAELAAAVGEGFDVSAQWPIRAIIYPVGVDEFVFAVVAHHIGSDGESMLPLITDVLTAYTARAAGEVPGFVPLPLQFADYAIWQREVLGAPEDASSVVGRQLGFWRESLAGVPELLELPTDRPRPAVASQAGALFDFEVPAEVAAGVYSVARATRTTPFMIVHAALAVLMSRLSGSDDVVIGSPIAGRGQAVLDPLVGMFVNSLMLRTHIDPSVSFGELLEAVRVADLAAFEHSDVPFEAVVDALDPVRSTAFAPLAQVWLSFNEQASAMDPGDLGAVSGVTVRPVDSELQSAKVDLQFTVSAAGEGRSWGGSVLYATDLFDRDTVAVLADRLCTVLGSAVADASVAVGDLPILLAGERAELRAVSQRVVADNVVGSLIRVNVRTLADLLPAAVSKYGESVAVVAGTRTWTFSEFGAEVEALAGELRAGGVGPGVAVAVCVPRSVELLIAVHAVIAAGGQYVPVAVDTPAVRAEYMLSTAEVPLVMTVSSQLGEPAVVAAVEGGRRIIEVDAPRQVGGEVVGAGQLIPVESPAYTIFTSGSTGLPKGVTVPHRAVLAHLLFDNEYYGFGPDDVFLQMLEYTFDPSVLELFRWVISGGRVVVMEPGEHRDPWAIAGYVERESVTSVIWVPSLLASLAEALDPADRMPSLRYIATGGEALTLSGAREAVERWPGARLDNQYGPTETTIYATVARVLADEPVKIGAPVSGVSAFVLDNRLNPVPHGVVGELYLGGVLVAEGYAARAGLTAERFVADPFEPGSRLYRTGDLVRSDTTGQLEYVGRVDFQIKLRGQRIEPEEIESVLAEAPGVVHAAVAVAEPPSGGQILVAYAAGDGLTRDSLEAFARDRLLPHMQPGLWYLIEEMPLNSAGKVDRRALPVPDFAAVDHEYVGPIGAVEEQLAAIVGGLLGIDRVSVTESFFALGGDSIMSIRLASAARAAGWELSPKEIFENRTVRKMAALVADSGRGVQPVPELPGGGAGESTLRPIVSWMLEHSFAPEDFADFAQSTVLVAPDGMTTQILGELLAAVVAAHPMLSARLVEVDQVWTVTAGVDFDAAAAVAARQSAHDSGSAEFGADLLAAYTDLVSRMDPAAGRLVQAALVTSYDGRARIVWAIHHLGVDAVSWPILIEDLITAWAQRQAGMDYALRPEGTSQRAWAAAVESLTPVFEAQAGYWLDRLPEQPTDLGAELDRNRDRDSAAVVVQHFISSDVADAALTRLPEEFGGSVDDVLLGTFARAVRSWQVARGITDNAAVSVLVERHGRDEHLLERGADPRRADLARTVGWFTTIMPLNLDPAADVVHAIKAAKEERLGVPDGGAGFGALRYSGDGHRATGELGARPLPSILFNYLGSSGSGESGSRDSNEVTAETPFAGTADAPALPSSVSGRMVMPAGLVIDAIGVVDSTGRGLSARFRFPENLLAQADVQDLADRWTSELADAVVAAETGVGLSPSDVPGSGVRQDELDRLAVEFPAADLWPLTPLQLGLFFQSGLVGDDEMDAYHVQARVQFGGQVDLERLQSAMDALLAHHDVLRSGYVQIDSGVVAVVPAELSVPLQVIDLADLDEAATDTRLDEIADAERAQRFDLSSPPLMRAVLVRHSAGADLVVTSHHLLFDGWSGPLVLADLLAAYATGSTFTPTHELSFADHVRAIAGADAAAGLAAWQELLAPVEGPTRIASAGMTGIDQAPREVPLALSEELSEDVMRLTRESGATLSTVLQAAWAVLLSRVTGNRVVTFGETVSGRPAGLDGVDTMVGLFINTLPVVVDADPSSTFGELLAALQSDKVRVLDHQHVGLSTLAGIEPHALEFDTLFVHESYPIDTESISTVRSDGLQLRGISTRDATHYPVSFITEEHGGQISGHLKYLPGAFDEAQVQVFADAITEILRAGAAAPDQVVADLPLLDSDERDRVLAASSGPVTPRQARGAGGAALADAVAAQVIASPEAAALVFEGREVSYREFGARVATLARELIAAGIGPDVAVGVCIDRSVELLVAIHAVTAAGGQYVPVDTAAPADRARVMLQTAGAQVVLVAESVTEAVAGLEGVTLIEVDASGEVDLTVAPITDADRLAPVRPESALYTLFTSGSTGVPKGVTVSHEAVLNRLVWMRDDYALGADARFLQKTPYTFDVSVWELYLPFLVGAPLVIARPDGHRDPQYLASVIAEEQVSVVHFVPSMLSVFLDVVGDGVTGLTSLTEVFTSGEALSPAIAQELLAALPSTELHNLYGPTEAAVDVTAVQVLPGDELVTIGRAVANTTALVLDDRLQPVPDGVPGELYLGGVQVARGYAAAPGLTAERFIADPYGDPGARLYRTGDLVKRLSGGDIEYLGRTDFQVKLRGQRIELGEIEAVIAGAPGVVHAAATVATAPAGGEFLVGYVSPASVDLDAVKAHVAASLPEYMRPSVWTLLEDVALNSAGKLDRRALPEPDLQSTAVEYVAPEGDTEQTLARVFAEILGVERVGVTESFFDAGGNSLSAMRVVARAGEALGVDLSIRDLFDAPTVRELAAASVGRAAALPPVTAVAPRPERIPLSFAQQRMWFINRLDPSAPTYNIPTAFRLRGDVDRGALRQAMLDVATRHEVLRTVFPDVDGVPFQDVIAVEDLDSRLDWRVVDTIEDVFTDLGRGFDVTTELPLRVRLLEEGDDSLALAVVVHHIAFDGQSFGPMVTDLLTAYAARNAGDVPEFAAMPVQYADYAVWQREVLGSPDDAESILGKQLAYWEQSLVGVPDVIELPTDRPRPPVFSSQGEQVQFAIPADLGARIDEYASRSGASRFMVLHAAFSALLARLSGSNDIVLGTPIDGRGPRGLNALVGMFVNTLVLRSEVDPAESFEQLMARIRAGDLDAFGHADVPFESIVDAIDPVRSEAFSPLVQVILSVDPLAQASDQSIEVGDVTVEPFDGVGTPAQMDLNLTIVSGDAVDWSGLLTFATAIFDRSTVEKLGARFVRLLDAVLASPTLPVGDVMVIEEAESVAVLAESAGPVEPILDETIADAVAAQVAARPDTIAVVAGEREYSYAEFGARIGELARTLIAAGVGPETAVGLVMDRSAELVIAVHAVMAAGGQYVPIAMDSPAERAEYVATTGGVKLVLVAKGGEVPEFVAGLNVPVLEVDCSTDLPVGAKPLDPVERLAPLRVDDAAYTLFTSGSTGLPKGVTISHGAVRNFVSWFDQTVPAGGQRLLFKTPHTFDASVLELFWPLVAGQTMVIADAGGERDPQYLAEVMNRSDVSVVQFVPSLLAAFLDVVGDDPLLPSLRVLFSGGEALPPAVAKDVRRRAPQAKLVNLFGPTESAVYTMSAVLDQVGQVVPIGAPMANTTALVLDSRLHPVPDGVAGELYLGGVQSARGYASRADLTAERFVADPFGGEGARLYRTGDLVKRNSATGELEYLGRTDFQVKLRGQRLELGEVEAAIAAVEGVVHAAARVVEGPAGDQLVGYVAPATVDTDVVAVELAKHVPEYMVPTVWVALEQMPLNTAGKVDRRSLPDPEFAAAEYVAPETPDEETVAAVYADLLGVDQVSVTESFFDVGGNSLAAMRLVARVSEALGVQVSVRDVFDAPSVRELVAAVTGRAAALPPVTKADPRPAQIPLSFSQQRMWFINRFDPSLPTYNIPAVLRIDGALDVAALRAAFADVVVRHEVLRTTFPDVDGVPVQVIAPETAVAQELPWSQVASETELMAAVTAGFDVTSQWPIRAVIYPASENEFVFAVVAHHIATDGESMGPLVTDVLTAYVARAAGQKPPFAPLPVQFADFAIWQREVLGSPDDADSVLGRQLEHWRERLTHLPDVLELPADRKRPAVASYRGAELSFEIPAEVAERVASTAAEHDVTPFMVTHAAFAVLLARLSATEDIAVATPVAGRGQADLDALIGMFVNTLVLRTQVDSGASFTELLRQVRSVDLDAFAHSDVPFEAVVDALDPVRSEAFAPLAQVMLSFDPGASIRGVDAGIGIGDLQVSSLADPFVPAQVDLTFRVLPGDQGTWSGLVVYATDLFEESTARWFAERFVAFLDELTADPTSPVGDAALLDRPGRDGVLAISSGPDMKIPAISIADVVAEQAARNAEAPALVFEGRAVSYAEFSARVATSARELIAAGVGPDVAVGVCFDRSVEMMVAIHAITAAGGQYVPIDVEAPADRARVMLETADARVVLVAAGAVPGPVADLSGVRVLEVDASGDVDLAVAPVTDADRIAPVRGDSALYTLFTSGSTGTPKGVTVSHEAVVNRLVWMRDDYRIDAADRFLQKTPYTFDVSVWELYLPFLLGAPLVIARPDGHRDPIYLAEVLKDESVSVVHFVPSMLSVFLDVAGRRVSELSSLRLVFTSGEALPPAVAQDLLAALPTTGLHNLYGPTEAAVDVTASEIKAGDAMVTIGGPVANTTALVLDDRLQPVPDGVPGELYLGGVQIARGYAAAPALTAERFIADPYSASPGARLYRTGDLVKRLPGGEIEYLGRTDFQVKLRGQRIELGEIEALIAGAPGVIHAAATVATAPAGGEFLVGYVAPASVDLDEVKAHIAESLPEYMRPSVWMLLDDVALNTAGKLDRRALPEPDFGSLQTEYVPPANEDEERVAEVFAQLLGVEQVSVTESFFNLGGNSLAAMRVVARVGEVLGADLSVRDVFDAPTVRELVSAAAGRAPALPPVTAVVPRPETIPLSFAQQRMWFINRLDPAASTYNIPIAFRLRGAVDLVALRQAVSDVVTRHEVLRTVFPDHGGVPYQLIVDADEADARLDWRISDSMSEIIAELNRGFDLTTELPLRVRVLIESDDSVAVTMAVHHISFDGQSHGPMVMDLVAAYAARAEGRAPEFMPLPVQYADYSLWQHGVLGSPEDASSIMGRQLAFWEDALAGAPDVIALPTDRPRPAVFSSHGDQVQFAIPSDLGARVDEFAAASGATRFMVLHAVFAALLARVSGTGDIVLGTPIDGRGPRGLNALVGMFVNTLVLRTEIDPAETFEALIARTRASDLDAFAHAEVPFESIVDAIDPVRSEAFSPLVQVILSVDPLAQADEGVAVGDVSVEPLGGMETPAQMDLNLTIMGGESGDWTGLLTFATAIFDRSTIEQLGTRFVRLLEAMIADPAVVVGDVTVADELERDRVRAASTGPVEPILDETIADAVAAQVAARPEAPALVTGDREITYREFGARIGELARTLIAAGVGPETAVAVVMDRSAELVTAIHAVMAAGGQYVPIATDSPVERAEYVASTAGVQAALVVAGAEVPEFVAGLNVPVLEVDCSTELPAEAKPLDPAERSAPLRASDAAYTLFTSGSTGLPKGVTIPHGAVRNFVAWFDQTVPAGDHRLLFKTPHTFDASVLELFWPLVAGQTMVIADAGGERDPQYLADVMNAADVSVVQFVPSLLAAFLDIVGDEPLLPNLQVLFSGGEALPPAVAKDFRRRVPQAKVVNLFGPTEAAVYTMSAVLDVVGDVVPIGRPMANTTALVLDSRLHPVPDGVPGELYLGGVQSARGYAARPDLTAERFIADPFGVPGERLYRTGDLVKRRPSGELEYLGRTDFQVKLRGQRLELGEVEAALAGAEGVVHAAARVVEGPAGDQLVGYVAPAAVDTDAIAVELAKHLPEYMVPTVWVALEEIPLNTAGKVDRRSLPDPVFEAVEYVAPATPDEETVAAVYAELLGVERVSVTESFFDAGGNSLAAMRLVARVSDALGVQVSVRDVFDAPSVRELVAAVAGRTAALAPVAAADPRPDEIPLSRAQLRMWYLNQVDPTSPTYNIPMAVRLTGPVDVDALVEAIHDALERHEVLRTIYPATGATPQQQILPSAQARERFDWAEVDSLEELATAATTGFDVSTELPIRGRIRRGDDGVIELAIVAHHIAFDGESMPVLLKDVLAAYARRVDPAVPAQPELSVQYADFALWEHDVLGDGTDPDSPLGRETAYWRDKLRALPEVTDLPMDRPRPDIFDSRGDMVRLTLDDDLVAQLDEVCRVYRVTPFMVTYAALVVMIARLGATSDAVVAAPTAGRTSAAIDDLVGMFVNTLVLRADVSPGHSVDDLLREVRKDVLDAFANADVQFDELVEMLAPPRSTAYSPLAQMAFTYAEQQKVDGPVSVGGIQAEPVDVAGYVAKFDLMVIAEGRTPHTPMSVGFLYSTALYDKRTVEGFAETYRRILTAIVNDQRIAIGDIDIVGRREVPAARKRPELPAGAGGDVEDGTLIDLLARRELDEYHPALISDGEEVDYDEFEARTNRVARALLARGITADDVVAIGMRRSIESVVAMWGVVKAGAASVAVDPERPDHLAELLGDRPARLAVTRSADADAAGLSDGAWLDLDELAGEAESDDPISDAERNGSVRLANLVYLAAAGETGPVAMTQASMADLVEAFGKVTGSLEDDPDTRILHLARPDSGRSFVETAWAITMGHTLVIVPDGSESGDDLGEVLETEEVTDLLVSPSDLDGVDPDSGEYVRTLVFSGEGCSDELVEEWSARGRKLFSVYDATGLPGYATRARLTAGEAITSGRPIEGVGVRLLDDALAPVTDGEVGELYVVTDGLARGVAHAPGSTSARLVADPLGEPGARMYRTGDRARYVKGDLLIVTDATEG
ncbi:non-ribosomal peptide synthase/polyketide synthase [Gordonia alkaliphila]|uniref:non-ribosomal peptide synthase/polyketide synthase n=1 Tax=Gordonia alkaliphila TaxID=1053547 RepID=UPI001FF1BED1|nr:non-ribosomal peptide synthase/polyketide synthase [Gordonia alkaliphila]MCK0438390.1 non-ribosomal peptide synthase/polyketide synthase [Gordonia alkaliphila]